MSDPTNLEQSHQASSESTQSTDAGKSFFSGGVLLAVAGVIIIAAAAGYKWFYQADTPSAFKSGQVVIVIDTGKIIMAATKKVMTTPNSNPAEEGAKLSAGLSAAIEEYRSAGAVIFNTHSVIYVPPEMDKTEEIAAKLGVTLE